jgi:proline dehydrogenase
MNTETAFQTPDLSETSWAYSHMSDKDLLWAIRLFKAFNCSFLVKHGPGLAAVSMKWGLPVKGLLRATIFGHFCGGEEIEACRKKMTILNQYGVKSILDYSVEGEKTESGFDTTCQEIEATIVEASINPAIPFAVFKVTGVAAFSLLEKVSNGEALSKAEEEAFQKAKQRIRRICQLAYEKGVRVMIDAEETWIQPAIDQIALEMSSEFNQTRAVVFNTLQLYRHDRLAFLKECLNRNNPPFLGFKLVRGAYMEKERDRALQMKYQSPIQPEKSATDNDYDEAVALCLQQINRCELVVATHNENSCIKAAIMMHRLGLHAHDDRIWFSQLLGMSDNISFNLAHLGYHVAKYVPYGPIVSVLPYLGRRAQENSSIKGQSSRELSLLIKEKSRRKKATNKPAR